MENAPEPIFLINSKSNCWSFSVSFRMKEFGVLGLLGSWNWLKPGWGSLDGWKFLGVKFSKFMPMENFLWDRLSDSSLCSSNGRCSEKSSVIGSCS